MVRAMSLLLLLSLAVRPLEAPTPHLDALARDPGVGADAAQGLALAMDRCDEAASRLGDPDELREQCGPGPRSYAATLAWRVARLATRCVALSDVGSPDGCPSPALHLGNSGPPVERDTPRRNAEWLALSAVRGGPEARAHAAAATNLLSAGTGPESAADWNTTRLALFDAWISLGDPEAARRALHGLYNHNYAFTVDALATASARAAEAGYWELAASWAALPAPAHLATPDESPLQRALDGRPGLHLLEALHRTALAARGGDEAPPRAAYASLALEWLRHGRRAEAQAALDAAAPREILRHAETFDEVRPWGALADARRAEALLVLGDADGARRAWDWAAVAAVEEADPSGRLFTLAMVLGDPRALWPAGRRAALEAAVARALRAGR